MATLKKYVKFEQDTAWQEPIDDILDSGFYWNDLFSSSGSVSAGTRILVTDQVQYDLLIQGGEAPDWNDIENRIITILNPQNIVQSGGTENPDYITLTDASDFYVSAAPEEGWKTFNTQDKKYYSYDFDGEVWGQEASVGQLSLDNIEAPTEDFNMNGQGFYNLARIKYNDATYYVSHIDYLDDTDTGIIRFDELA